MDRYKQKLTQLQSSIFRLLCMKAGISLNQREIARLLAVSPTAVAKALPALQGLLNVTKSRKMNLVNVTLNRENAKAIAFKRVENLKLLYESGVVDFVYERFPGCAVVLFGSFSKGEDTENSDIDVAIIGSKPKRVDLTLYEKLLERKVYFHYYESLDKISHELRMNILNGITMIGVVDV